MLSATQIQGNQGALQVVAGDMQSCAKLVDGSLNLDRGIVSQIGLPFA